MRSLTSNLYKAARVANDARALTSGSLAKILRRLFNKWLGRNTSKMWKL